MDQTDQKRARSKFFSVDIWRVFGPPSGKKKEIWFMLKHGQNSRFNFHIIEKLSAPWWLRWKEKNLFDPMGFLWDVYWPHWPSLVQIRGPPWVRHESLAPRISVKVVFLIIGDMPIFICKVVFLNNLLHFLLFRGMGKNPIRPIWK